MLINDKMAEMNDKIAEMNDKIAGMDEKMERKFNNLERKITSIYEIAIENRLKSELEVKFQKTIFLEPRRYQKTSHNIKKDPKILDGFNRVESLHYTSYSEVIKLTNKAEKLDPFTNSIQINFWGEDNDGHFGLIEGTMSNLMENHLPLLSKLLQLERQIVFAQGYRACPEYVGFVSPSLDGTVDFIKRFLDKDIRYRQALPNVDRYLKSNKFFAIQIGSIPDIE
jgi:hypothetical protein